MSETFEISGGGVPPASSSSVGLPESTKDCTRCNKTFPDTSLYFAKHGNGRRHQCHECWRAIVMERDPSRTLAPAKNGCDQMSLREKKAPVAKPISKDAPWLSLSSAQVPAQTDAPLSAAGSSSAMPVPKKTRIQTAMNGDITVTLEPYLDLPASKVQVPRKSGEAPVRQSAPPPPSSSQPIQMSSAPPPSSSQPMVHPRPAESSYVTEEQPEEPSEEEMEAMFLKTRCELTKMVDTYSHLASLLGIKLADIPTYSPEEIYNYHQLMSDLKGHHLHTVIAWMVCLFLCRVVEITTQRNELVKSRFDLTGFSERLEKDPHFRDAVKACVEHNSETISEWVDPNTALAGYVLQAAGNTIMENSHRHTTISQMPGYRNGNSQVEEIGDETQAEPN